MVVEVGRPALRGPADLLRDQIGIVGVAEDVAHVVRAVRRTVEPRLQIERERVAASETAGSDRRRCASNPGGTRINVSSGLPSIAGGTSAARTGSASSEIVRPWRASHVVVALEDLALWVVIVVRRVRAGGARRLPA
jgi:hypothetical protein